MKKILVLIAVVVAQLTFSQEKITLEKNNSTIFKQINSRKGQFFASWGWNRASYATSDISFKGDDFNFILSDVKSNDKPKPFGIEFLAPDRLTIPQTNFEIGYFIKDNYNIVFGYDHMKYVMRNNQTVNINGEISTGSYLFDEATYNFDGTYENQAIDLSRSFLLFEHTDGLNYIFVGANRFDNLNKLLRLNTTIVEVNLEEGVDFGFVMPRTNSTILGNKRYDQFHVAGFGLSASAGLNLTFFKHFYIKTDFKIGYINMPSIRITENKSEKAKQHFTFAETSYTFGYRFYIF